MREHSWLISQVSCRLTHAWNWFWIHFHDRGWFVLLPHHLYCLLGTVQIELVVLFSLLGMLICVVILLTISIFLLINSIVKSFTICICSFVLCFGALHSRQKELLSHRGIDICQRAIFSICWPFRVSFHSRIYNTVLH